MTFKPIEKILVGEYGYNPFDFWSLTLAEVSLIIETRREKEQSEYIEKLNLSVHTAFFTVKFMREKQAIKLEDYLYDEKIFKPQKEQTENEMIARGRMINAALGGDFIEYNPDGTIYKKNGVVYQG